MFVFSIGKDTVVNNKNFSRFTSTHEAQWHFVSLKVANFNRRFEDSSSRVIVLEILMNCTDDHESYSKD